MQGLQFTNKYLKEFKINTCKYLYNSGFNLVQVGKQIGLGKETVRYHLIKSEIKIRPRGRYRTCSLNESVFETLNPKSCYWIGMLLADGNIYSLKNCDSYTISYSSKDKEHVEKFKLFMGSGRKISRRERFDKRTKKWYISYELSFSSKKVYVDLISWYIEPRKSTREKVHPKLKYNRDFWRGMFDGDGSLSINKKNRLTCYQLGSDNVINNFRDFLDSHYIKYGKICKTKVKGLYIIKISTRNNYIHIYKFYNLIYKDAPVSLDRKRNFFKNNNLYKYIGGKELWV